MAGKSRKIGTGGRSPARRPGNGGALQHDVEVLQRLLHVSCPDGVSDEQMVVLHIDLGGENAGDVFPDRIGERLDKGVPHGEEDLVVGHGAQMPVERHVESDIRRKVPAVEGVVADVEQVDQLVDLLVVMELDGFAHSL